MVVPPAGEGVALVTGTCLVDASALGPTSTLAAAVAALLAVAALMLPPIGLGEPAPRADGGAAVEVVELLGDGKPPLVFMVIFEMKGI